MTSNSDVTRLGKGCRQYVHWQRYRSLLLVAQGVPQLALALRIGCLVDISALKHCHPRVGTSRHRARNDSCRRVIVLEMRCNDLLRRHTVLDPINERW